jgi:hypothetical protein
VFIVTVYRWFPSLSGRAQISRLHSPRPLIPCLSTAHLPYRATRRRAGRCPPPAARRAGLIAERVPNVFPLTDPSSAPHARSPPPPCPALAPLCPAPSSLSPPPGVRGGPGYRGVRARASSIQGSRAVVARGRSHVCREEGYIEGGGDGEGGPSVQDFLHAPFP